MWREAGKMEDTVRSSSHLWVVGKLSATSFILLGGASQREVKLKQGKEELDEIYSRPKMPPTESFTN